MNVQEFDYVIVGGGSAGCKLIVDASAPAMMTASGLCYKNGSQ